MIVQQCDEISIYAQTTSECGSAVETGMSCDVIILLRHRMSQSVSMIAKTLHATAVIHLLYKAV